MHAIRACDFRRFQFNWIICGQLRSMDGRSAEEGCQSAKGSLKCAICKSRHSHSITSMVISCQAIPGRSVRLSTASVVAQTRSFPDGDTNKARCDYPRFRTSCSIKFKFVEHAHCSICSRTLHGVASGFKSFEFRQSS
jgi:hypothetical protein